ncbi:hypothetical protein SAMN04244548_01204 [Paracoccus pantotrophus]|nr:hypothetical protein SAMN04244548_01204 [Paracoccus pantotrophus]
MQPSEIARHRGAISASVEVVLRGYWRDDMPDAMAAAILADWCDEMEPWPVESVRAALRKHRAEFPNRKPNPGHILAILNAAWGKRNAPVVAAAMAEPATPPKERITEDRRKAILAEMGVRNPLAVKTVAGIEAAE